VHIHVTRLAFTSSHTAFFDYGRFGEHAPAGASRRSILRVQPKYSE